jgi:hypothetical protein
VRGPRKVLSAEFSGNSRQMAHSVASLAESTGKVPPVRAFQRASRTSQIGEGRLVQLVP